MYEPFSIESMTQDMLTKKNYYIEDDYESNKSLWDQISDYVDRIFNCIHQNKIIE